MTTDHREILMGMYRAFNDRDLDGATEFLAPEVDWPNAMTGERVQGRAAVRAYWKAMWTEIDPRIEPLKVTGGVDGKVHVRVHQFVRARDGAILEDRKVEHIFTFDGAFISRMTIVEADPDPDADLDDEEYDDKHAPGANR